MKALRPDAAAHLLWIHMDSVTRYAPLRRKHKYGPSLTLALFLLAVAGLVFGRAA